MKDLNLTKLTALTSEEAKKILAGISPEELEVCGVYCKRLIQNLGDMDVMFPPDVPNE